MSTIKLLVNKTATIYISKTEDLTLRLYKNEKDEWFVFCPTIGIEDTFLNYIGEDAGVAESLAIGFVQAKISKLQDLLDELTLKKEN